MKRILCVLFLSLLLVACLPTPDEDFVVNKADGTLDEIIHATAAPDGSALMTFEPTAAPTDDAAPTEPMQTAAPMRTVTWTDSFSVAAAMDRLTVTVDASVQMPESGIAPVYRCTFAPPDQTTASALTSLFFGDSRVFLAERTKTKSFYKAEMERIVFEKERETEERNREEWDRLLKQASQAYGDAPEDITPVPWDGGFGGAFDLMAEKPDGTYRYLSANERGISYTDAIETPNTVPGRNPKFAPETQEERDAYGLAVRVLEALHIDAELAALYPTDAMIRAFGTSTVDGYYLYFYPRYGGLPATLDASARSFHGFDNAEEAAGGSAVDVYSVSYEPETIEFLISNGTLVRFRYVRPAHILRTENEAAQLLPLSKVQELFKDYIGKTTYVQKGEPLTLHMHTVRLTMQRCPIENNATEFYLLPAWEFLASVDSGNAFTDAYLKNVCVLRINALDGSILR